MALHDDYTTRALDQVSGEALTARTGSLLGLASKLISRAATRRNRTRRLVMVLCSPNEHDTRFLRGLTKHLKREYDVVLVNAGWPARRGSHHQNGAWADRKPNLLESESMLHRVLVWFLINLCSPRFIVLLPDTDQKFSVLLEWAGHTTVRCLSITDITNADDFALAACVWTTSGIVFLDDQSIKIANERCFALAARNYAVAYAPADASDAVAAQDRDIHARRVADAISSVGAEGVRLRASERSSRRIILRSNIFDGRFACGFAGAMHNRRKALQLYLTTSRLAAPRNRAHTGRMVRRPAIGFNPLIYAADSPGFNEAALDPLADFIRNGRPEGRWTHDVLAIAPKSAASKSRLKVAIQAHFFYEELFPDLLARLGRNASHVDLYVTTSSLAKAEAIAATPRPSNIVNFDVRVVPNRGRDIGALLSGYDRGQWDAYDILGHVHGKRCSYRERAFGDEWRTFMWGALIGNSGASMDAILDRFASDDTLGLVFPEDPFLHGMDGNQDIADRLAERLSIRTPLPAHFEFPMGSMYLARPRAIADLWKLGLLWPDYPEEPIPNDGTLLHALERMLTFLTERNGYRFATAHVRGSYRG